MNTVDPPLTPDEIKTTSTFRKRLRESEKAYSKMTVEVYNATIDPYRSTSLNPTWPHPLHLQYDSQLVKSIEPMESEIAKQLWIGGLHNQGLVTVALASADRYTDHPPQKLLSIRFVGQVVRPDTLDSVVIRIQKILDDIGCEDIRVDIYNPRLRWFPVFFDVPCGHPAYLAWEECAELIRGVVCPVLGAVPVKFGNVGWHQRACIPSVVILVARSTEAYWASLRKDIRAVFSEDLEIEVEFIPRWDSG
ncbi:hypothetical protein N7490_007542 [Penicillium lividum]|nr:hypothetical protein N7490_007542 [Penicillium lividum]